MRDLKGLKLCLWVLSIIITLWLWETTFRPDDQTVEYIVVKTDNYEQSNTRDNHSNEPLIFIGGVPRSGTTLMRAMLDAHPDIRCGEETRILPRLVYMRNMWTYHPVEKERLISGGMTDEVIDSAMAEFIYKIIEKHGKKTKNLCNKDPLILMFTDYMKKIFPKSKYILMIRDGRATVHSIITRKVTISGFDLTSYRQSLIKWNELIETMYSQCMEVGPESCLPVHYEQLVLHPEKTTKKIFEFLNIPWNNAVIHHEKFIGEKVALSKNERSSDQVVKPVNLEALISWVGRIPDQEVLDMDTIAPMLRKLGYDPHANPPNYGDPDEKIKDNTINVQKNMDFWNNKAREHSIFVGSDRYF